MQSAVIRWRLAIVLLAVFAAVAALPAGFGPAAPLAAESAAARDLEAVAPTDVGVSAKRLERLAAGMQEIVDDGKLAGVVTLLARGGKLVHATSPACRTSTAARRWRAIRSSASIR